MKTNDQTLENIIFNIESFTPMPIEKISKIETFELWYNPVLLANLEGNIGILFVRALLNKLNINEHHVFRWRLDNKYVQSQVLNHYLPDCVAETIGFSQILREDNGVQKIRELCANGFFIKSTLGDSSGRTNGFDRTDELDSIIRTSQKDDNHLEKWILQKRLNLKEEYRVHSFDKDVLYGLTFIIKGKELFNRRDAEKFVKEILEKLPDVILQGTLIGWDIGITDTNEYYIIEANITGFHPEFRRGFQTSGYFGDPRYGSIMCAWLNNYFKSKYQISITSVETDLLSSNKFYQEFLFYSSIFKHEHLEILRDHAKGISRVAIIYLDEDINDLLITLLNYFILQGFAKMYYLIVDEEHFSTISNQFAEKKLVRIVAENSLFTEDQYSLIKELSYERRKKISCYYLLRMIKEKLYFII